jgi:hypothetical protein
MALNMLFWQQDGRRRPRRVHMNHVATPEFPWGGQLDTTHEPGVESIEAAVVPALHGDRYGLARGVVWGVFFSVPIWSAVAVIAVG